MLKKRIIPCLDVANNMVVKGVKFRNHEVVGDIIELAKRYCLDGADELVFYDITASSDQRIVDKAWVSEIARVINIPFCVAGGIRDIQSAEKILANGADKISINSPALENPSLITELALRFGSQCIVVGIDSLYHEQNYIVNQYTGDASKTVRTSRNTLDWAAEAVSRGAGEIVLNCMNQDGVRNGYDLEQISLITDRLNVPVVASGGAGTKSHFYDLFAQTKATGALAASVFHKQIMTVSELKEYLKINGIMVRYDDRYRTN